MSEAIVLLHADLDAKARTLAMLRRAMVADATIAGGTLIMPGGGIHHIERATLLRQPDVADA